MKLLSELIGLSEGRIKPGIRDEVSDLTKLQKEREAKKSSSFSTRVDNLAKKAGVSPEKVEAIYDMELDSVDPRLENRYQIVWANVKRRLNLTESEIVDDEDDFDSGVYEREKKVSVLILRTMRKCGLQVAEHESRHSGTRDHGDSWGYDVLYTEDDREATVELEEADLDGLVKLHGAGLIEGKCEVTPSSNGTIRLTFKVDPAIASGNAEMD